MWDIMLQTVFTLQREKQKHTICMNRTNNQMNRRYIHMAPFIYTGFQSTFEYCTLECQP